MAKNLYEQWAEAQKSMMDVWMKPLHHQEEVKEEKPSIFESMMKLQEEQLRTLREFYARQMPSPMAIFPGMMAPYGTMPDASWQNLLGFQRFLMQAFVKPEELWDRTSHGFENMMSAYDLWRQFSGMKEMSPENLQHLYQTWSRHYADYLKGSFVPALPRELQQVAEKYVETAETWQQAMMDLSRPFVEDMGDLGSRTFSMMKGPGQTLDFFHQYAENLKESVQAYTKSPLFVGDVRLMAAQTRLIERWERYSDALSAYYSRLGDVIESSAKEAFEEFTKALQEGVKPKSFEEFYHFWTQKRDEYVKRAFGAEELQHLSQETANAMEEFRHDQEAILREMFSFMQGPNRADVEELQRSVTELGKKIDELDKQMKELGEKRR